MRCRFRRNKPPENKDQIVTASVLSQIPEPTTSTVRIKHKSNPAEIITGVFWLLYLPYLFFIFAGLSAGLARAKGAPQEAAGAAMAAAYAIIPYCGLRAWTEIVRLFQGK